MVARGLIRWVSRTLERLHWPQPDDCKPRRLGTRFQQSDGELRWLGRSDAQRSTARFTVPESSRANSFSSRIFPHAVPSLARALSRLGDVGRGGICSAGFLIAIAALASPQGVAAERSDELERLPPSHALSMPRTSNVAILPQLGPDELQDVQDPQNDSRWSGITRTLPRNVQDLLSSDAKRGWEQTALGPVWRFYLTSPYLITQKSQPRLGTDRVAAECVPRHRRGVEQDQPTMFVSPLWTPFGPTCLVRIWNRRVLCRDVA